MYREHADLLAECQQVLDLRAFLPSAAELQSGSYETRMAVDGKAGQQGRRRAAGEERNPPTTIAS